MVNSPLIRPAISWGKRGIVGVPLGSHDKRWAFFRATNGGYINNPYLEMVGVFNWMMIPNLYIGNGWLFHHFHLFINGWLQGVPGILMAFQINSFHWCEFSTPR